MLDYGAGGCYSGPITGGLLGSVSGLYEHALDALKHLGNVAQHGLAEPPRQALSQVSGSLLLLKGHHRLQRQIEALQIVAEVHAMDVVVFADLPMSSIIATSIRKPPLSRRTFPTV